MTLPINKTKIVATMRERAEVVGMVLRHGDGTVNHAGTTIYPNGLSDHIGRGDAEAQPGGSYVPAVTFAAVLIRRAWWQALDGLDEAYLYRWEDTDFCLRTIERGGRVWVERDAQATHDECGTRTRNGPNDRRNIGIFLKRWQPVLPELLAQYARRTAECSEILHAKQKALAEEMVKARRWWIQLTRESLRGLSRGSCPRRRR